MIDQGILVTSFNRIHYCSGCWCSLEDKAIKRLPRSEEKHAQQNPTTNVAQRSINVTERVDHSAVIMPSQIGIPGILANHYPEHSWRISTKEAVKGIRMLLYPRISGFRVPEASCLIPGCFAVSSGVSSGPEAGLPKTRCCFIFQMEDKTVITGS